MVLKLQRQKVLGEDPWKGQQLAKGSSPSKLEWMSEIFSPFIPLFH